MWKHCRIMIIDDEEFCISAVKNMLLVLGIDVANQVDFCISGQDAINMLKERYSTGMNYKLILTDFKMPGMDGIEATRQMRKILTDDYKYSI